MATEKGNGCLGLFFKGLLIIFLIGNGYAVVRVEWARIQVYRLARQLDYQPEHYLHSALVYGTTNLVTGAAESYVVLYYTTPLTPATYRERLAQIDPKVFDSSGLGTTSYLIRELGIAVFPLEEGSHGQNEEHRVTQPDFPIGWLMLNDHLTIIDFQVLSQQDYRVEYQGRPITGNIAKITVPGGTIQPWFKVGVLLWEKVHFFGL